MSRYGERYVSVDLDKEVAPNDWELLDRWFGMHMVCAPDVEERGELDDYLTNFGWKLAQRFKPEVNDRMRTGWRTNRADEEAEEELSDDSLHYKGLLIQRLTVRWLALD